METIKLKPFVSEGILSYIINQNGNALGITLQEYGSCTPIDVLQIWIDGLSLEEIKELSEKCDKKRDVIR